MDRRRLIIILALALGLVIILAAVGFFVLGDGEFRNPFAEPPTFTPVPPTITVEVGQQAPVATAALEQEFIEVVVSLQTVPRGFRMTEGELTTEIRLADEVKANAITRVEDVIGLFARTDIYQGETLTYDSLVRDITTDGQQDYGPSSIIPPGYVAMSVPMDRIGSVAYGMASGDFVDVLITFVLYQVDEQFQSRLPNDATFFLEQQVETGQDADGNPETTTQSIIYSLSPYGRFETQPDGSIVHVSPSELTQRGVHVAFLIQNAKVIQVGPWIPPSPAQPPTPTPDPDAEEDVQQGTGPQPTPTLVPEVALIALPPQQQLFLKYAVETNSVVDFALRGVNDGELYPVENVTLDYIIEQFNVEIPPNFTYITNANSEIFRLGDANNNPELVATVVATPEFESSEN